MKTNKLRLLSTVLPALFLLAASMSVEAKPSNKWRLEFSGGADSDGTIVLLISQEGFPPIEARIPIADGTGENAVAKAVVNGLKAQLPEDHFKVERDDGEDVLIKKRRGSPDFDVTIVSLDVKGVRIKPERK
ncbi:MAG: hypothetical protein ACSLE2_15280 [Lysobacterales bacterium]